MKKFLLALFLLAPIAALAEPFVFQPGSAGGSGTVTSVTPGEGVSSSAGTCATGAISASGTLSANCLNVNQQTGATYTTVSGDCGKVVQLNRGTAVTLTLASASSNSGCLMHLANIGAGNVTVATAIDGVSNRIIQQHGGVAIFSNEIGRAHV